MKLWGGRSMTKLEELKAMVSVLQRKIEALEKPKQWEPRGNYRIKMSKEDTPTMLTIEAAEKASSAMRSYNRLLAYVDEFGGDWEADWSFVSQNKYCITYDKLQLQWEVDCKYRTYCLGAVYMSKECAEGLVTKLESGEVVL
jgi:hypothetical protein